MKHRKILLVVVVAVLAIAYLSYDSSSVTDFVAGFREGFTKGRND